MKTRQDPEDLPRTIADACQRLVPDFRLLRSSLLRLHPDWSRADLAANLMEFGRGQISRVVQPSQTNRDFIATYVNAVDIHDDTAFCFCAYASGCLMGWVHSGEIPKTRFIEALRLVQLQAETIRSAS